MNRKLQVEQYEKGDVNVRRVAAAGFFLVAALVVILVAMAVLMAFFTDRPVEENFPAPSPQTGVMVEWAEERAALEATQAAQLHSYGWVNEEAGVARIPIERAMEILAEEGRPTPVPSATPEAAE